MLTQVSSFETLYYCSRSYIPSCNVKFDFYLNSHLLLDYQLTNYRLITPANSKYLERLKIIYFSSSQVGGLLTSSIACNEGSQTGKRKR